MTRLPKIAWETEILAEEKTPFITWISTRGLRAGDQVAFGAAQAGALQGVTALDRASVELPGTQKS